jgi:hypothetical protein
LVSAAPAAPSAPASNGIVVALEGVSPQVRGQIAAIPGITLSQDRFDLLVREDSGTLFLYHRTLALIRKYTQAEMAGLLKRIAEQPEVEKLLAFHFDRQDFALSLDLVAVDRGALPAQDDRAEFARGETVAIRAAVDRPAYLLVVDIDNSGVISVLYPGPTDRLPFAAGPPAELARTLVRRPTGTEVAKAFGFASKPAAFDEFICRAGQQPSCPEVEPGDPRYRRLLDMLASASMPHAAASVKVVTKDE